MKNLIVLMIMIFIALNIKGFIVGVVALLILWYLYVGIIRLIERINRNKKE